VIALQAVYQAGKALCPRMTMTACLAAAVLVVLGASAVAMAARAAWLSARTARTARAVAALPRAGSGAWPGAGPPLSAPGCWRRVSISRRVL